ncbi:hypothetical protein B0F90DRAFT_1314266 [Multifurca ochricompacta]|uniref:Uncharacterized protein n=1 Tax=Multifurca ochricompacta TaxID=376703 RepID=A0AAD4QMD5_9AGAM|nr:hypothetical protein B0F90DRAFT_1314266 [Multifurca ochricompacta]
MLRCCLLRLPGPCLVHRPFSHAMRPDNARETPPLAVGAMTHVTPPATPQCSIPPPVSVEQQLISPAAVPAARVLRRIFSKSNLACKNPEAYSLRTIRKLYLCAHAQGMLDDLSGPQFSAIISLFGTLSVPDPPSQFTSPLSWHMNKKESRAWWGFVFQLVRDKKRVTGILKDGDLYWLMRAKASESSHVGLNIYSGDGASSPRLAAARERYLNLEANTVSADDHVPYLKALLSLNKHGATTEAVAWLCHLMKRDIYCPPGLLNVLWDVVLSADRVLSEDLKERILDLILQRLTLPADFSEDARVRFSSLPPEPSADAPEKHPSFCLTASDLVHQVVRILFPRVAPSLSGTPSQLSIQEWAYSGTQRMFSPSARTEFRWQNLVYLALANTHSTTCSLATVPTLQAIDADGPRHSAVDFRLVAVIALVERISSRSARSVPSDLHNFIHALWKSWANIINNDPHAHRAVVHVCDLPPLGFGNLISAMTSLAGKHNCLQSNI